MGSDRRPEKCPRWGSAAAAAQVIASNEDLLTELLLRLPAKSLVNFKSVCKHWLALITAPHFTHRKDLKCNTISALYVRCWSPEDGVYFEFVPLHPSQERATLNKDVIFAGHPDHIKILHLCNGLLCYCCVRECRYFVYNTTTKQFKTLPRFGAADMRVVRFNLAFDPSKSHFYNVVCILVPMSSYDRWYDGGQVLIYSSETRRWRVSGASISASFAATLSTSRPGGADVYCNGAMHWFNRGDTSLYFDLGEEVFQKLPIPPCAPIEYFGESGGHVYLVESLTAGFSVLEMKIDRSGWFVKFRVDLSGLAKSLPPYCCATPFPFRVLCIVSREKDEDSFMVMHQSNGKIISHNFIRKTHLEILSILPTSRWPIVYPYIETISLV